MCRRDLNVGSPKPRRFRPFDNMPPRTPTAQDYLVQEAYRRHLTDNSSILSPHSYSFKLYRYLSMNRLNSYGIKAATLVPGLTYPKPYLPPSNMAMLLVQWAVLNQSRQSVATL
ncbi:hypothetical protein EVAR_68867_1 [Eumeta japonica]|uniref:Uncharacterized protein n=1 Tax=Eumeta variegata TaxID=151549 RepID=A0A4C1ZA71_EUMVA|nr:hypothetical protein EVAR_68867_1 [Eumeta japonica]